MKLKFSLLLFFNYLALSFHNFLLPYSTNPHTKPSYFTLTPMKLSHILILHCRLSTITFTTQCIDNFSYEIPSIDKKKEIFLVTNMETIGGEARLLNFSLPSLKTLISVNPVFQNTNWLEREVGEMQNLIFLGKGDTRNLMLPYGDSSAPLQKLLPSVGLREIYYDWLVDLVVTNDVSIQF